MNRLQVRQMLLEERQELADLLAGLTTTQWESQSLCDDWSVLDVAGHLASSVGLTRRGLIARNVRYGAGTDGANARSATAWTAGGTAGIVEALADRKRLGLGFFYPKWALCEAVVHHQDIRLALDRPRDVPQDRLRVALSVLVRLPFITKASRPSRRVSLRATDVDWTHGKGPEVHGPAQSMMMALAGRSHGPPELAGPGVKILMRTPTSDRHA